MFHSWSYSPKQNSKFINDDAFKSIDGWHDTVNDDAKILGHICNNKYQRIASDGTKNCRKINYNKSSNNPTKQTYMQFAEDLPEECIQR